MNTSNSDERTNETSIEQILPKMDRELNNECEEFNKKIQELENDLTEERKRSETYLTQLKYLKADFDNYQKRVSKEIERLAEFKIERILIGLLEPLDELQLAVEACRKSELDVKGLVEGVNMILTKLQSLIRKEGISPIEALGLTFDPVKHHAVSTIPTTKKEMDNTIVNEIRKGYMLKDRVIRPSMVEVARLREERSKGEKNV